MHFIYHFEKQPLHNPTMQSVYSFLIQYFYTINWNEVKHVVVCQNDGRIIGACLLKQNEDIFCVMKMCTHHDYRKRGIATQMLNYVSDEFKQDITVHVDKNARHDTLVTFYQNRHFEKHSETDFDTRMIRTLVQ